MKGKKREKERKNKKREKEKQAGGRLIERRPQRIMTSKKTSVFKTGSNSGWTGNGRIEIRRAPDGHPYGFYPTNFQ